MQILNIAGYKFILLDELSALRARFLAIGKEQQLRGTILLSTEGINLSLCATPDNIALFKQFLLSDARFRDITFRESVSTFQPFRRLKVKLKKEIITMRCTDIKPETEKAPCLSPEDFKKWLDEKRDVTLLDARNDYEVQFGTFEKAVNLRMHDFSEFPQAAEKLQRDKPIVMFCTGGIRCEKAALHLANAGFTDVYQLEGGILNYFAKVGNDHYQGECFVFDGRVSLDATLQMTGTLQCVKCQGPQFCGEQHFC